MSETPVDVGDHVRLKELTEVHGSVVHVNDDVIVVKIEPVSDLMLESEEWTGRAEEWELAGG